MATRNKGVFLRVSPELYEKIEAFAHHTGWTAQSEILARLSDVYANPKLRAYETPQRRAGKHYSPDERRYYLEDQHRLAYLRQTYCDGKSSVLAHKLGCTDPYVCFLFADLSLHHFRPISDAIKTKCTQVFPIPKNFWTNPAPHFEGRL